MAKRKGNKTKRPVGRPRTSYTYEEAKRLILLEGLQSRKDYDKWWALNHPCRIPKRPDRAYKSEGFKWSDFLGTEQRFPMPRKSWRPYDEARTYAISLGIKTQSEWVKFAKTDKCPDDIPTRPDITYRHTMKWISWRDWLGSDLAKRHEEMTKAVRQILYIVKLPNKPGNVYKIKLMVGKIDSLVELQKKNQIRIIRCFYIDDSAAKWRSIIDNYCTPYLRGEDGEYSTSNVALLISELANSYQVVNLA